MKKKVALIFGITGQDGSYLSEFLLSKNYVVHGVKRRSSSFNTSRLDHLIKINNIKNNKNFILHYGDITDTSNIFNLIHNIAPDEVYNLAAQSHVKVSFETPEYTANTDALGTIRILESIRSVKRKKIKFYQASSSEMYGNSKTFPITMDTPMNPVSPYGTSKLFSYKITQNYRNAYGIHATNGILFNHESPRRGETFVSRKITIAVKNILLKKQKTLFLGNLNAKRDWGHALDYVESMWKIINYKKPDDFIISTSKAYSVRNFVEECFKHVNINIKWKNKGIKEVGINTNNNEILVRVDPIYFRPNEIHTLIGDYSKAKKLLKWKPNLSFKDLVNDMMSHELKD
jgi:GDPmannose 4,6-dehydratase